MEPSKAAPPQPPRYERSEDFSSIYANSVLFESTVFDLRITFGQIEQGLGLVEQHTSVTIPWPVAKLGLYYLSTQVAGHELVYGKIPLPPDILPQEPPPPPAEQRENPLFQKLYEAFRKIREEFIKTA